MPTARKPAAKKKKESVKPAPHVPPKLAKTKAAREERARAVDERLSTALPTPRCELDFKNAWQLLVATILSAQSTDKTVNRTTPILFERYPTPAALAKAPQEEVEDLVKSTGFFRNKAKAIREASALLEAKHKGEVPRDVDAMLELPGVARKTANVVLGTAYGIAAGITVDTHVGRVTRRLGLTEEEDPVRVERDLMALFPKDRWIDTGHRFVLHGRYVCLARSPHCAACPINELCPSAQAPPDGPWEPRAAREKKVVESRGEEP